MDKKPLNTLYMGLSKMHMFWIYLTSDIQACENFISSNTELISTWSISPYWYDIFLRVENHFDIGNDERLYITQGMYMAKLWLK